MTTLTLPEQVPSPTQDAETLREALHGLLANDKGVIQVLGHRNAAQRKIIRETYQESYNESLIDSLHSKYSFNFGNAVIWWTYDPAERDARLANKALNSEKIGTNELQVIVEISCASSPQHLLAVRERYCSLFQRSLEEDIIDKAPPSVKKILVGLVSSYRFNGEVVDLDVANDEASKLHEAIQSKQLNADNVVWILSTRNFFQLKATFESYHKKYGNFLYEDIKDFGDDVLESLVRVVIMCIVSPEKHFVENIKQVVKAAIGGWGTNEDSLSRVIVSRAEIDLMKVSDAYFEMYEKSLDNIVEDETSGTYHDFLIALLGK